MRFRTASSAPVISLEKGPGDDDDDASLEDVPHSHQNSGNDRRGNKVEKSSATLHESSGSGLGSPDLRGGAREKRRTSLSLSSTGVLDGNASVSNMSAASNNRGRQQHLAKQHNKDRLSSGDIGANPAIESLKGAAAKGNLKTRRVGGSNNRKPRDDDQLSLPSIKKPKGLTTKNNNKNFVKPVLRKTLSEQMIGSSAGNNGDTPPKAEQQEQKEEGDEYKPVAKVEWGLKHYYHGDSSTWRVSSGKVPGVKPKETVNTGKGADWSNLPDVGPVDAVENDDSSSSSSSSSDDEDEDKEGRTDSADESNKNSTKSSNDDVLPKDGQPGSSSNIKHGAMGTRKKKTSAVTSTGTSPTKRSSQSKEDDEASSKLTSTTTSTATTAASKEEEQLVGDEHSTSKAKHATAGSSLNRSRRKHKLQQQQPSPSKQSPPTTAVEKDSGIQIDKHNDSTGDEAKIEGDSALSPEDRIREELKQQMKEEVKKQMRLEMEKEAIREQLRRELREELKDEIQQELEKEFKMKATGENHKADEIAEQQSGSRRRTLSSNSAGASSKNDKGDDDENEVEDDDDSVTMDELMQKTPPRRRKSSSAGVHISGHSSASRLLDVDDTSIASRARSSARGTSDQQGSSKSSRNGRRSSNGAGGVQDRRAQLTRLNSKKNMALRKESGASKNLMDDEKEKKNRAIAEDMEASFSRIRRRASISNSPSTKEAEQLSIVNNSGEEEEDSEGRDHNENQDTGRKKEHEKGYRAGRRNSLSDVQQSPSGVGASTEMPSSTAAQPVPDSPGSPLRRFRFPFRVGNNSSKNGNNDNPDTIPVLEDEDDEDDDSENMVIRPNYPGHDVFAYFLPKKQQVLWVEIELPGEEREKSKRKDKKERKKTLSSSSSVKGDEIIQYPELNIQIAAREVTHSRSQKNQPEEPYRPVGPLRESTTETLVQAF